MRKASEICWLYITSMLIACLGMFLVMPDSAPTWAKLLAGWVLMNQVVVIDIWHGMKLQGRSENEPNQTH